MGKRKVESSDEEDDDEPLILKSVAKKIHVESEDEDGGGKSGVGGDAEQGDAAQEKQAEWSGSDEEDRFMRIMQQHGSPVKSSSKTLAKTAKAGATVSRSLSKSEDTKEDFDAGGAAPKATPSKADPTPGKIKFSKSVQLVVPNLKKVSRSTFVLQCEDPTFDVDGDSGVIGTVKSTDSSLHLDIKGQLFEGSIVPCNSMMVVDLGASECRIEAVMHDFVQLKPMPNPHGEDMDFDESEEELPDDESGDEAKSKKEKGGKKAASKKPAKKKPSKKPAAKKSTKTKKK